MIRALCGGADELNLVRGMRELIVARVCATNFPMVCAVPDAVPPVRWACSITTLLVLQNGGVFRKTL